MNHTILVAGAALGLSTPAFADVPGQGWLPVSKVAAVLEKRGYQVTKIEADDGHWEGEAILKGAKYDFHVDPRSGRILKMERDHD
jgi:hypothetical protein